MSEFLKLLRAALYGDLPDLAPDAPWNEIALLARQGAVVSLTLDALARLPREAKPPRAIVLPWIALAEQKQEHNRRCAATIATLSDIYAKGVEWRLLKGFAIGGLYADPLLRDGGDVDVLITHGYERANELIEAAGGVIVERNPKHTTYNLGGILVENHCAVAMVRSANAFFESQLAAAETVDVQGVVVETVGVDFNAVYLVEHVAMHLLVSGIGLRHLCDLALFFTKRGGEIDRQTFARGARCANIDKMAPRIFGVLCKYLGAHADAFPVAPIFDDVTETIFEDVITGGNFGFFNDYKTSDVKMVSKSLTMKRMVMRVWKYRAVGGVAYAEQIGALAAQNFKKMFGK